MTTSMVNQISKLRGMSVAELQAEWQRLYGESTRSRNREFLFRRLAWRLQELQHGGLSDAAKARISELAPKTFTRARTPASTPTLAHDAPPPPPPRERSTRDPRLPTPGSVISKPYKGAELRVVVREDGYEFEGGMYSSLTAIAKQVTRSRNINGKLFFGLTQRSRA